MVNGPDCCLAHVCPMGQHLYCFKSSQNPDVLCEMYQLLNAGYELNTIDTKQNISVAFCLPSLMEVSVGHYMNYSQIPVLNAAL